MECCGLASEHKQGWNSHANKVIHAYTCTINECTGYSPFYLLFGRSPRLPVDVVSGIESNDHKGSMQDWTEGLKAAYEFAQRKSRKAAEKGKRNFDKKGILSTRLIEGDRVLVRNLLEKWGPGKLRSHWEQQVYVVTRRLREGSPVNEVRRENGKGRIRVLHRNLLMQGDYLPFEGPAVEPRRRTRKERNIRRQKGVISVQSSCESEDLIIEPGTEDNKGKVGDSRLNPGGLAFIPRGFDAPVEQQDSDTHSDEEQEQVTISVSDESAGQSPEGSVGEE